MKYFFNPFERIAGWQALVVGVFVMALTAVFGKFNNVAFDGVLDVHRWAPFGFSVAFAMQAVNFLVLFLTMWLAGVCFSKSKVRAIDVAGTTALARTPMLLLAIICFLPIAPAHNHDMPRVVVFSIIVILFIVWMVALMYNAYSVSCNLKGGRAVGSFIGALLAAEIVSKIVVISLLSSCCFNASATCKSGINSTGNVAVVADSLTIRQKTENVANAFEQGDFDAITLYFDATMKRAVSSGNLKTIWTQTNIQFGKFEKADWDNLTETQIEQYDVFDVPFLFQRGKLNLRLVFNKDGSIAGLFLQPS